MRKDEHGRLVYSPTDLIRFMESPFASWMERLHLEFPDQATPDWENEEKKLIAAAGDQHEARFLKDLKAQGRDVCVIERGRSAESATSAALQSGREVIYQGCLSWDQFRGFTDFLFRTNESTPAAPVYEVWDTKLARKPKPYYLVQLCCYAEMLGHVTRVPVPCVRVVLGNRETPHFNPVEFRDYYLQLKAAFLRQMEDFDPENPPLPDPRADHGRWASHAEAKLVAMDHMVQVAGITVGQIKKLNAAGIMTVAQLAAARDTSVPKLSRDVLTRLVEQAALQVETRKLRAQAAPDVVVPPVFRVLRPEADQPRRGLALLPPESAGDVFFDMEGFPLVDGGLEYLFGAVVVEGGEPRFHDWWAHNVTEEQAAFGGFVDYAYMRWKADPAMHIYHYAAYEVSALRRLMGKFGSREQQVDDLLRHGVFIDLYQVVKQGLRVGESSYSIKLIEHLYRPARATAVATAGESVVQYAHWIESGQSGNWRESGILGGIRDYNRDDCESTWQLAEWLRARQREERIDFVPPPAPRGAGDEDEDRVAEEAARARLFASLNAKAQQTSVEGRIATILRDLIEFHRREAKPQWWRFFERLAMTHDELKDDIACIGDAALVPGEPEPEKKSLIFTYRFDPEQDSKIGRGDKVMPIECPDVKLEVVEATDAGILRVKIGKTTLAKKLPDGMPARTSFIPDEIVGTVVMRAAIEEVAATWDSSGNLPPALRRFLLRLPPTFESANSSLQPRPRESFEDAAVRVARTMRDSILCLQGPPGTGKTRTASAMIVELLREGKRVGVMSNSHKAIINLMSACQRHAGGVLNGIKVGGDAGDPFFKDCPGVTHIESSSGAFAAYHGGVVGGTAWLFSRTEWIGGLDYLFVDEAGQVSLGNLTAVSRAASNLVLLGDQMQLEQPTQGSHPGESGLSALNYYLHGHATIPETLGLFLPQTWRLHPDICRFVSDLVYEGRLTSAPGTELRRILPPAEQPRNLPRLETGIVFDPVIHDGNVQASDEEVERIATLADALLGREYTDHTGQVVGRLDWKDLLFVAPYNMQVQRLRARLGAKARVGSVDKFQGQEAAVVFVSMCSSFGEYGSRGIEFILDQNRVNVALSRAQILAVVVGDPRIATTPATSIDAMRRLNLYCRLVQQHGAELTAPLS